MNVSCPKCQTVYRIDPSKVPQRGVRARCSECAGVFFVGHEAALEPPLRPAPVTMPPAASPPAAPARPAFTAAGGAIPQIPYPAPMPVAPAARPAVPPQAPPMPAASGPTAPAAIPPTPAMPIAVPTPQAAAPAAPTPAPPVPPVRRPVNPFLAQDPATKARRLARALISDLVVYHPAKRADGLRDGTLKLVFEDEIKKCWEEYTDQVGLEMATSTPYFTEALNEILADGQPVFS
jgi:predicted Zn finger-like uncharacterized protein